MYTGNIRSSRQSAIESLEHRTHLSAAKPVLGTGVVIHEQARVSDIPGDLGSIVLPLKSYTSVAVHWGDGQTTTAAQGTNSSNNITNIFANQPHTYARPGKYAVTVDIFTSDGTLGGVIHDRAIVAKNLTAGKTIHATTTASVNRLVGIYDSPNSLGFGTITIDWGDQSATSTATVVKHGSLSLIYGTHQYAAVGVYQVRVLFTAPDTRVANPFLPGQFSFDLAIPTELFGSKAIVAK